MRGASNPSGKGKIPSIHPDDLKWTKEEIAEYLSSGLTPNYDVAGGSMALVVENLSKLSKEDLLLIASYIKNEMNVRNTVKSGVFSIFLS